MFEAILVSLYSINSDKYLGGYIMCGRYYLADLSEDDVKDMKQILRDIDKMSLNSDLKLKTEGEIFQTDIVRMTPVYKYAGVWL